jgi:hypothetical protein
LQIRDRVLNSITTILMRNHDNIATAVNSSYKVMAFRLMSAEEQEVSRDDESEYQESESSESVTEARDIVIANPWDDDNYAFIDNLYLLVEKAILISESASEIGITF